MFGKSSYQRRLSRRVRAYRRSQAKARQDVCSRAVEQERLWGPRRHRGGGGAARSLFVPLGITDSVESMTPFMNALIDDDNAARAAARVGYDSVGAEADARWVAEAFADIDYKQHHPDPRCRYYPDLPIEMFRALELSRISEAWNQRTSGDWELTLPMRRAAGGEFRSMVTVLEELGQPEMAERIRWCIRFGWERKYDPKPAGMPDWETEMRRRKMVPA